MKPLTNLIYKPAIFIDKRGKLKRTDHFALKPETQDFASLYIGHPAQPAQWAFDLFLAGKTIL